MKNLMIYVSPTGSFNNPHPLIMNDAPYLVKVQIENSIALGWKPSDILLYTNFDFQYGKFKAKVLKDVEFFEKKPQTSKVNAIVKLFQNQKIKDKEVYWFHDLDAFQLEPIAENELEMGKFDMALTDYGGWSRWNTGTIFFKAGARDIFEKMQEIMYRDNINEEKALGVLTRDDKNIKARVKKLNTTYNFTPFNFSSNYASATKPLKIVHFHPLVEIKNLGLNKSLDFFLGKNKLGIRLINKRLIKIFKYHKIS